MTGSSESMAEHKAALWRSVGMGDDKTDESTNEDARWSPPWRKIVNRFIGGAAAAAAGTAVVNEWSIFVNKYHHDVIGWSTAYPFPCYRWCDGPIACARHVWKEDCRHSGWWDRLVLRGAHAGGGRVVGLCCRVQLVYNRMTRLLVHGSWRDRYEDQDEPPKSTHILQAVPEDIIVQIPAISSLVKNSSGAFQWSSSSSLLLRC